MITHLNDYGVLIGWGESCGKGLTYTNSKLRTYLGDFIKPEGMIEASFMYENQCLVVVINKQLTRHLYVTNALSQKLRTYLLH